MKRRRKNPYVPGCPPYKMIESNLKENSDLPEKGMLWIKVGLSMRNVRLWETPMAERYSNSAGEEFEFVKMH
jgi:hypothetical protein